MSYRNGDRVRSRPNGFSPDGRTGVLVRKNEPFNEWLVALDGGGTTWWFESYFAAVELERASA